MSNGTNNDDHVFHSTLVDATTMSHRRAQVANQYLEGIPQQQIAINLGVHQSTISRDMKEILAEWRESAIRDFDEARQIELNRLFKIEAELWAAWEKSKQDATSETEEISQAGKRTTKKKEGQTGDPRYLSLVFQCIDKRTKLLGLDQNVTRLEIRTWEDRVIEFLKDGRITPVQLIDEIGENAARPLLNRANMGGAIIVQK